MRAAAALLALCAAGCGGAPARQPRPVDLDQVARAIVAAGAPGALLHVRDGARTWSATAGLASVDSRRALRPGDPFRLASLTKPFLAAAVLDLEQAGRLTLDDTVGQHLPSLLPDGDRITIRKLLTHTSGLDDHLDVAAEERRRWTPRALVSLVAQRPRRRGFHYSSTNYVVAGLVAEVAAGQPLAALMPAGYAPGRAPPGTVHGHRLAVHDGIVQVRSPRDLGPGAGSFLGAGGALVMAAPAAAEFFAAVPLPLPPAPPLGERRYGLGLVAYRTPCGPAYGHTGSGFGLVSAVLASRDGRRVVVGMANGFPLPADAVTEFRRAMDAAYCGHNIRSKTVSGVR